MTRLPIPGEDAGQWGQLLNTFLEATHAADGTLKPGSVGASQLQSNSVTNAAIAADAVTATSILDGSITRAQLALGVQDALDNADAAVATNLSTSTTTTSVTVVSTSGTDATIASASGSAAGVLTSADKTKLDGIAAGASTNSSDAVLLNRANHTGTQTASTIIDFNTAADARADGRITASTSLVHRTGDESIAGIKTFSVSPVVPDTPSGGTAAVNQNYVQTAIAGASGGVATNLSSTPSSTDVVVASDTGTDATIVAATGSLAGVMSGADKAKLDAINAGATVNSSDATLLNRANHTGTQTASTIIDFNTAADARITAADVVHKAGTETVSGVKTFSASPIVPDTPSGATAAVNKTYADTKAPLTHNHAASAITSGVVAPARLGSGTANSSTYLRGDNTWASVSASAVSQLATFTITGAAVAGLGQTRFIFPRAATVVSVRVTAGTAPTGSSLIIDVNKNGTTLFTTQANRPTITAGQFASSKVTPAITAIAADDYLTVDVDQIGSSVAGSDLCVVVEYL